MDDARDRLTASPVLAEAGADADSEENRLRLEWLSWSGGSVYVERTGREEE